MPATEKIRAPLDRIMPSFIPVMLEKGVPGYLEDHQLVGGERRLAIPEIRSILVASAYIGADAATAEHEFDQNRVPSILTKSIHELEALDNLEKDQSLHLANRFYSFKIIRAENNFDDWICEALWGAYQTAPYVYPSAMSGVVSYGLTIMQSLRQCSIEYPLMVLPTGQYNA